MIDLSTTYLGLKLRNPLVASASPPSQDLDNIRRLESAGASAVVLYLLFEEQLRREVSELEYHLAAGTETFAVSIGGECFDLGETLPGLAKNALPRVLAMVDELLDPIEIHS
jgi:hypothetical protein